MWRFFLIPKQPLHLAISIIQQSQSVTFLSQKPKPFATPLFNAKDPFSSSPFSAPHILMAAS